MVQKSFCVVPTHLKYSHLFNNEIDVRRGGGFYEVIKYIFPLAAY